MDSIKEKLPKMLLENMQLIKEFRADTYKDAFQNLYENYRPLFQQIEELYITAEDKETLIADIAEDFVRKVKTYFEASTGKRKKDSVILDYNMVMSSFVIPCILEFRGESSVILADGLLSAWNHTFVKYKLQKGTFADIDGSFKRKLCFITTAVCDSLGKPDDCYELTILRAFRDNYMMHEASGKELVMQYYDMAPDIVMRINQHKAAEMIYDNIYKQYISPCISFIEQNKYEKCEEIYTEMVYSLRNQYMGGIS